MMRKLIPCTLLSTITILLSALSPASATNYYFSSSRGDDARSSTQAQSAATPWRTLNKLNSFFINLKGGDSVLFERGGVFMGRIIVAKSGTSSAPIKFAAFGSGADPIITGFASLTGWASAGSNIWQAPCTSCGYRVNMVSIGDSAQPMGRTPNRSAINGGYDTVKSHSGTSSITGNKLGSGPNYTGADVVIRKNRWVLERDSITSHSGTVVYYATTSTEEANNNFGYFIQNHVQTLDQQGEWFFDAKAKVVKIYWPGFAPTVSIQASAVDTLVTMKAFQYISFNGIQFTGANKVGFSFLDASNITITNCKVRFTGVDAIRSVRTNYIVISGCTVDYSNSNAIDLDGSSNTIQDCRIIKTGTIPGAGNAIHSYQAITILGSNNVIQNNFIDTTGYNPVVYRGSTNTVKNNLIDYYCYVKDDGGGIYTWNGDIDSGTRRVSGWVTGNIVLNGVTAPNGTNRLVAGIAHGIYIDENTGVANISGNTVARTTAGIFMQDSHELTISGNTLYDNTIQLIIRHAQPDGAIRNNDIYNNIGVSRTDSQNVVVMSSIASGITGFGSFHNNKYARVSPYSLFFRTALANENNSGSFSLWQTNYNQDWGSAQLPLVFAPYTINSLLGVNMYTKGNLILPFQQTPVGSRTIVNAPVGAVLTNSWYVAKFTLHAPDNLRTLLVYLQKYQPPYTHFTPVISIPSVNPATTQQIVFNTTGGDPNSSIVFQMNQSDPRVYIDNITLYKAVVTPNDINQMVYFQYNASKIARAFALSGTYQDVSGTTYTSSVTIQPYSSVVLFKK